MLCLRVISIRKISIKIFDLRICITFGSPDVITDKVKVFSLQAHQPSYSVKLWVEMASFWAITQRVIAIPYRHFGTTYRSHLQGSRIQDYGFLTQISRQSAHEGSKVVSPRHRLL